MFCFLCFCFFENISNYWWLFQNEDENITYKVEVSYIEIYNEKVRDLLCPRGYVNVANWNELRDIILTWKFKFFVFYKGKEYKKKEIYQTKLMF